MPIVILDGGKRRFLLVRWGLVPSWAKEAPASLLINARAETVAEKPSFRGSFRHRRALMPADGFYEWKAEGSKKHGGAKQPYVIRRRDRQPFAMAALWDNWMPADGSEIDSCAAVTCEANETLIAIHHRMPVILDEKDWDTWLDPATPPKELQTTHAPRVRQHLLDAQPVSTRINRVANDDATLLDSGRDQSPNPKNPPARKRTRQPDRWACSDTRIAAAIL